MSSHDPQKHGPVSPEPPRTTLAWARVVPVTASLIVINTLCFALEELWGARSTDTLLRMGAIDSITGQPLDPRTLVTYGYLHFSLLHLVVNMYALWGMGRSLEPMLGPGRFFVLYTLSLLGGGLFIAAFASGAITAGASGALFGLLGAICVVMMIAHQRAEVPEQRKMIRERVAWMLVPNIMISLVPGVSFAGHAGGLVVGMIFVVFAYVRAQKSPDAREARTRGMNVLGVALAVSTAVVIGHLWLTSMPWHALSY